ncbi:hypothetical protein LTR62_007251 [Meristemomyces frigidus]|uniref:Ankyrin repeat protein n=1 Tax=Meristemomyces frigidus TaxID=1508187 RepID=A0AAN7YP07_9PEZI|nr:hypothetical protein LTR62_007251 [Meristemomyces frigidus]
MAVDSMYARDSDGDEWAAALYAVKGSMSRTLEGLLEQSAALSQRLRGLRDDLVPLLAELALLTATLYGLQHTTSQLAHLPEQDHQRDYLPVLEAVADIFAFLRTSVRFSQLDETTLRSVVGQLQQQRAELEHMANQNVTTAWPPTPPCEEDIQVGSSSQQYLMPPLSSHPTGITPSADPGSWIEPPPEYSLSSDPTITASVEKPKTEVFDDPAPPELQNETEEQIFDTDALFNAVTNDEVALVTDLLEQHADPNEPVGELQRSALHQAAHLNRTKCLAVLLRYGASMTVEDVKGDTPLHLAAWSNSCEALSALLLHSADVDWLSGRDGYSPLWCAVSAYHIDAARLLLRHGARVSLKSISGAFLLHQAAVTGQSAVCELLLERGAQVDSLDADGQTALHYAAASGSLAVVKVLLRGGGDVSVTQAQGLTCTHWAAHKGHAEVLDLILSYGAEIDPCTLQGATPLHMAACQGHLAAVRLLLEKGAKRDVEAEEWNGTSGTPRAMAVAKGHRQVVKLLRSWSVG